MNRTFASFAPHALYCPIRPVLPHTPCFATYALYCPIRPERAEAPSPGHRPGLLRALVCRPVRAKALKLQVRHKVFALTGRLVVCHYTQGDALG